MNKGKKYLALLIASFVLVLLGSSASAASLPGLTKKALLQGISQCDGKFTKEFASVEEYKNIESLYTNKTGLMINLPSGKKYSDITDGNLNSCSELIKGYNGWGQNIPGIYEAFGSRAPYLTATNPVGSEKIADFLTKAAGYKETKGTSSGGCYYATYTISSSMHGAPAQLTKNTPELCFAGGDDLVVAENEDKLSQISEGYTGCTGVAQVPYSDPFFKINKDADTITVPFYADVLNTRGSVYVTVRPREFSYKGKTWSQVKTDIGSVSLGKQNEVLNCKGTSVGTPKFQRINDAKSADTEASFKFKGINSLRASLLGKESVVDSDYLVSQSEKIALYQYYLTDLLHGKITCGLSDGDGNAIGKKIKWFPSGSTELKEDCFVEMQGLDTTKQLNAVTNKAKEGAGEFEGTVNADGIIEFFNSLEATSDKLDTPADVPETGDVIDEELKEEQNCYTHSGALGWIACPIIDSLGKTIQVHYAKWIEPSLKINVGLFAGNPKFGNPTLEVWSVFQTIANIGFVIFMLFIIFSQLTGIGIDNYGIKKTLPRLLVAAILINLSYIVCQLAIDVGNVLGAGIGELFTSITKNIPEPSGPTHGHWVPADGTTWAPVVVACVGAIVALAAMDAISALLIPVVMVMISVACAVLATFVLLGLRQALAVLLVVFSPLAFLCYMLPNTKSIYDKWFKMFKGLLIAYPVCSALIFGGDMIGKILLTTIQDTNYWVVISAALISVAPVFAIPKVVEKSMGAIGALVGGWGRSGGRRLGNMAGASHLMQDYQQRSRLRRQSGIKYDRDGNAKYTVRGKLQNVKQHYRNKNGVIGRYVLGGAAATARLEAARAQSANAQAATYGNGDFTGDDSAASLNNAQNVVGKAAAAKVISKIGTDPNQLGKHLEKLLELRAGGPDTAKAYKEAGGDLETKAALSALASLRDPEANKKLVTMAGRDAASAEFIADYAIKGDSAVAASVRDKSSMSYQMLRDISNGEFNPAEGEKEAKERGVSLKKVWADTTPKGSEATNLQKMASVVDTSSKLCGQTKEDLEMLLTMKDKDGHFVYDQEMLLNAFNSQSLQDSSGDKLDTMRKLFTERALTDQASGEKLRTLLNGYQRNGMGPNDMNSYTLDALKREAGQHKYDNNDLAELIRGFEPRLAVPVNGAGNNGGGNSGGSGGGGEKSKPTAK